MGTRLTKSSLHACWNRSENVISFRNQYFDSVRTGKNNNIYFTARFITNNRISAKILNVVTKVHLRNFSVNKSSNHYAYRCIRKRIFHPQTIESANAIWRFAIALMVLWWIEWLLVAMATCMACDALKKNSDSNAGTTQIRGRSR